MLCQVVTAAVRTPDALDPTVAGEALSVPTVARVVGHLVGHVLPETQSVSVHTD